MNPAVLAESDSISVTFMASILIWFMAAGLAVLWLIDGVKKKEQALHAIFSVLTAYTIVELIKTLFPSLRPFNLNNKPPLTLTIPNDASFPSTHAAVAFAMAASVWMHKKKTGIFFLFFAVIVALGRILGNVHNVMDVIAGAILGTASAYILRRIHLFKALK